MVLNRQIYKWFYNHIHSHYYNLLIKWCFLPFGGEAKCREELIASVNFLPREKILDMCCGTGSATYYISKKSGKRSRIMGLELSSGQLSIAKKESALEDIRFIEGDAECTPFKDNSFNKVFITHALHEMPRESRKRVLRESRRILKNNGTMVILELDNPEHFFVRLFIGFWFFYWLPFNFETSTRRDLLKHGLTKEVKEAGFKHILKISKYYRIFQIVQGVK